VRELARARRADPVVRERIRERARARYATKKGTK